MEFFKYFFKAGRSIYELIWKRNAHVSRTTAIGSVFSKEVCMEESSDVAVSFDRVTRGEKPEVLLG